MRLASAAPRGALSTLLAGAIAPLLVVWSPGAAQATDLVVQVSGMTEQIGQIGCALFANDQGFPMDNSAARTLWLPVDPGGVTCRFPEVAEGSYAVSIAHDLNGNRRVDTNFIGMPTEAWGVSNNVRPILRAPKFAEASFRIPADRKELVIDIKVAK